MKLVYREIIDLEFCLYICDIQIDDVVKKYCVLLIMSVNKNDFLCEYGYIILVEKLL